MSWLRFCVLSAVLCSFAVVGQADVPKQSETILIPVSQKNVPEIITTSAPAPAPTSAPSTSPDPAPTTNTTTTTITTTLAPPTTPPAPPTTPPAPPTTPPAPPTTPPAPTPAPAPKPLPPAEQGKWSLKQNNVTCIVAQFAAQLTVLYTKDVNNSNVLVNATLNVPKNATVAEEQSSCGGNGTQWLTLTWPSTNTTNNVTLVFYRNDTTKNYALKSFNVSLANENLPNAAFNGSLALYYGTAWLTPLATSYRCYTPTKFNMTGEHGAAVLTLSQLQEEAFRTSSGEGFSAARECGGGDVPDAVPIAVGCALGGLVVVVLIAYLVGRRRSAARGYLSM